MKIKDYIINNFKEDSIDTLRETITSCLMEDDEETLPGMGVFLELIWENSNEKLKKEMLTSLYQKIKDSKWIFIFYFFRFGFVWLI